MISVFPFLYCLSTDSSCPFVIKAFASLILVSSGTGGASALFMGSRSDAEIAKIKQNESAIRDLYFFIKAFNLSKKLILSEMFGFLL